MSDDSDDNNNVWKVHVPQWGVAFPSILHLVLALSALHFGCQQPGQREQYVLQAVGHFSAGIRSMNAILSQLDSGICQIVYMSAVLICFVYFARGPQPGEYLVFSDSGRSEFLVLLRGVRSIMEKKRGQIFTGVLTPRTENRPLDVSPLLEDELLEHKVHIEEVRRLFQSHMVDSDREMYMPAIDSLLLIFEDVYKIRSVREDGVSLMHLVIGWMYRLPELFVGLLEEKDPFALITLAYWSILLKYMGTSWLVTGWDQHVISGIQKSLRQEFYQWIEWPVMVIHDTPQSSPTLLLSMRQTHHQVQRTGHRQGDATPVRENQRTR